MDFISSLVFIIIQVLERSYKRDDPIILSLHHFKVFYVFRGIRLIILLEYTQVVAFLIKKNIFTFIYGHFLLFIVLFIFTLFGYQFFGDFQVNNSKISSAYNFKSFSSSFITVFNVITLENWYLMFIETSSYKNNYITMFYFLSIIILGNLLIYHLFLAIMLDAFESMKNVDLNNEEHYFEDRTYDILKKNFMIETSDESKNKIKEESGKKINSLIIH